MLIGRVRTAVDRIYVSAEARQRCAHGVMNVAKIVVRQQTTSNACLVAANRDLPADLIEARNCVEAAGYRRPLRGALDIFGRVFVDDSISIEQYERHPAFVSKMLCNLEVIPPHGQKHEMYLVR